MKQTKSRAKGRAQEPETQQADGKAPRRRKPYPKDEVLVKGSHETTKENCFKKVRVKGERVQGEKKKGSTKKQRSAKKIKSKVDQSQSLKIVRPKKQSRLRKSTTRSNDWTNSISEARAALGVFGFEPLKKGSKLYIRAKEIHAEKKMARDKQCQMKTTNK